MSEVYKPRQPTKEELSRPGKAWRTEHMLPKLSRRRRNEDRPPPIPREFPCPTCTAPTTKVLFCEDCGECVVCRICQAKHAADHTEHYRRMEEQ